MARALDVWCFEEKAGVLVEDDAGRLSYSYEPSWLAAGRPPLSYALPLNAEYGHAAVTAYFGGLLPEGDVRRILSLDFGVSQRNDFSLLERIGGDCAGAVSLHPPGEGRALRQPGVDWLDDKDIEERLKALPQRPMLALGEDGYRLSLAGAQDKLPVVIDGERIGLPKGGRPSTHILKAPISWLPDTVANEAFCLAVGRELGLSCVEAAARRIGEAEVLAVTRYDRERDGNAGIVRRLHQEDFCQALGVASGNKYESEGGPSLLDCVGLIRETSSDPVGDLLGFVDGWALSFLAGNHDAHGKNYSVLYRPESTRLAPAYDIISSISYLPIARVDKKMAMKLGNGKDPHWLEPRHLDAFLEQAQLGKAPTRRRLLDLAARIPGAVGKVRGRFESDGWWSEHLDRVAGVFQARCRLLTRLAQAKPPPV